MCLIRQNGSPRHSHLGDMTRALSNLVSPHMKLQYFQGPARGFRDMEYFYEKYFDICVGTGGGGGGGGAGK